MSGPARRAWCDPGRPRFIAPCNRSSTSPSPSFSSAVSARSSSWTKCFARTRAPNLRAKLFEPYFALVRSGKLDEAYERFTAPRYREQYSLEGYRKTWAQRFEERGAITALAYLQANRGYDADDAHYLAQYRASFERRGSEIAVFRMPDAKGGPRLIDRSSRIARRSSDRVGGPSSTAPEAW
jgi:hypothetical protein